MRLYVTALFISIIFGCSHKASISEVESFTSELAQKVYPSVIHISVVKEYYNEGKKEKIEGAGSGVLISQDGYALTNYHVAGNAADKKVRVKLFNRKEVDAQVVGDDPYTDLAMLRVDLHNVNLKFHPIPFANESNIKEGQFVSAFGSPIGMSRMVTYGFIAGVNRTFFPDVGSWGQEWRSAIEKIDPFTIFTFHTAPIYGGNSGGPLVNKDGELVGINSRGLGLSVAIALPIVKETVERLKKFGRGNWSWIGVKLTELDEQRQKLLNWYSNGVFIRDVVKNSPAYTTGIRSGNILIQINNIPVNAEFKEEIPLINLELAKIPIGSKVKLTIISEGQKVIKEVETIDIEEGEVTPFAEEWFFKSPKFFFEAENWGLVVKKISLKYAVDNNIDKPYGVLVDSVRAGTPSELSKIQSGDVIKAINGESINDLSSFQKFYEKVRSNKNAKYLLQIQRDNKVTNVILKVE